MSLSCSCDFDGDFDWYYMRPEDYSTLKTKRRKRCSSCGDLIDIGAISTSFDCWRPPRDEMEERIHGEDGEVYTAPMRHCERCADLYFSLRELGFECVGPDEDMRELVKEYAETYGPKDTSLNVHGGDDAD